MRIGYEDEIQEEEEELEYEYEDAAPKKEMMKSSVPSFGDAVKKR